MRLTEENVQIMSGATLNRKGFLRMFYANLYVACNYVFPYTQGAPRQVRRDAENPTQMTRVAYESSLQRKPESQKVKGPAPWHSQGAAHEYMAYRTSSRPEYVDFA